MSAAKLNFDKHIRECDDALQIYRYLGTQGYQADFGLRYVWVGSVSAIDHYVTELVIEKSTSQYANQQQLSPKLLNGRVQFSETLPLQSANLPQSVEIFRKAVSNMVRFETFQRAETIADGLAYIWQDAHKWQRISRVVGLHPTQAKDRLNQIADRRNLIAHNADYDESSGVLNNCSLTDAEDTVNYIKQIVTAIESLVP